MSYLNYLSSTFEYVGIDESKYDLTTFEGYVEGFNDYLAWIQETTERKIEKDDLVRFMVVAETMITIITLQKMVLASNYEKFTEQENDVLEILDERTIDIGRKFFEAYDKQQET